MNHCLLFGATNGGFHRSAGAHRIASYLRLQNWDAEVIDFAEHWSLDQLKLLAQQRITKNTKFLGYSFTFNRTTSAQKFYDFNKWVRETWPHVIFISGGHSTPLFDSNVDYHVMGYGEYALDALLKWLFSNGEKPKFNLLLKRTSAQVIDALHAYPAYPFPDADIKYERRDFMTPTDHGSIEFSRGCKFQCKFCNFPILGVKGDYSRSQESVYEQLMYNYDNFGIQDYGIADETFNDRTEKITKFADVVERLPWRPYFSSFIRPDLIISRPQDREELLRMGLTAQFYGVETFNPKSAKYIGKGMDPEKVKAGLIDVKNFFIKNVGHRYRAYMSLIAGLPYETLDTLETTKQWVKHNWMDQTVGVAPLIVHQPDEPRSSILDSNYQKLGYEAITFNVNDYASAMNLNIDEVKDLDHFPFYEDVIGDNGILWKNTEMTVYQAAKWASDINNLHWLGNISVKRIDALNVVMLFCDENGVPLTTDQKLKLIGNAKISTALSNANKYIQNYINKKLNV